MQSQNTYTHYQVWKQEPVQGAPYLSIVIPAYNEADRIVPTVGAIAAHICTLGFDWELIVADDGSTDETVALLQELEMINLHILVAEQNGGKGMAVHRGIIAARGDFILFTDADNSTPIEEIGALLALAERGNDVVVGSRAAEGAQEINRSFLRQTMSETLRWIVQHPMQIGVADTQCGFKLFSRAAAQQLFTAQTLMGFSFDLEILYLASKYNLRIVEQPVEWHDAPGSKVDSIREARRFIQDLARIKINDWRGKYDAAAPTMTLPPRESVAQFAHPSSLTE